MNKIKFHREAAEMTQEELGIKLGYTIDTARQNISQWETGRRKPKIDKLMKIAEILNVELNDLI